MYVFCFFTSDATYYFHRHCMWGGYLYKIIFEYSKYIPFIRPTTAASRDWFFDVSINTAVYYCNLQVHMVIV